MFGPRSLGAMPLNLLEPRAAGDRRVDQRNDLYGKVSENRTATVIDKPMAVMDQDMDEGFSYPSLPESSVLETRSERYPTNKENGSSRDYRGFRPEQGPSEPRQVHKRKPEERSSDLEPSQGYKRRTEERRWDAEPSHGYKRRPDERPLDPEPAQQHKRPIERPSDPEPSQQHKRPMERPRSDPEPIARSREQVKRESCVSWEMLSMCSPSFCCSNFLHEYEPKKISRQILLSYRVVPIHQRNLPSKGWSFLCLPVHRSRRRLICS